VRGQGWNRAMRFAAIVLLARVMAQWIALYPAEDADDKAVHYYSAIRLYAGAEAVAALEQATPGWLAQLDANDSRHGPERTRNRLASYWNYPLPSSLLRVVVEVMRPRGEPPSSFLLAVEIALTLVAAASLAWLAWVAWRPGALLFVAICLGLCMAKILPAWLEPKTVPDYSVLVYAPRGAAFVLLLAAMVAAHQRRWGVALASMILGALCHVGLALLTTGPALLAVALGRVAPLSGRGRMTGSAAAAVLAGAASLGAPSGPWLPAISLAILFQLTGRVDESMRRAAAMAAGFIVGAGALSLLCGEPAVAGTVLDHTTPVMAREVGLRLSGARYLAAAALLLAATVLLLHAVLHLARRGEHRPRALAVAGIVLAAFLLTHERSHLLLMARGRIGFLKLDLVRVERHQVTTEALPMLDPRREDSFFASLGDFLLRDTAGRDSPGPGSR
jgi:hypothetical protein